MNKKIVLVIIVLFLLGIACGISTSTDKNANPSEGSSGEVATPKATATLLGAGDTPETVETAGIDELPPLNLEEVLQAGVDAGEWSYEEGLILILKYLVNQADEADIPSISQAVFQSGTGIAQLAKAYVAQPDGDPETQAELARLLDTLFIPQEVLDMISRPAGEAGMSGSSVHLSSLTSPDLSAQNQDVCQQALETGNFDLLTEDTVCFLFEKKEIDLTTTVWVYYPTWPDGSEVDLSMVNDVLETMADIAVLYDSYNGLEVKKFYFLILPQDLLSFSDYTTNLPSRGEENCLIMGRTSRTYNESESEKQDMAVEMFHCVNTWSFSEINHGLDWWRLPTAFYFSNVAIPSGDGEWWTLPYFDERSVNTSIPDMRAESFIFFQWLGNVYGSQQVVDIMHIMHNGNIFDWISYIAPGAPGDFTRFVVEYLSIGIADENTGAYFISPDPPRVTDTISVDETGEFNLETEFLVAKRYYVDYKKEKRFLQTEFSDQDAKITGVEVELYQNLSAWSGLPPEIRSSCNEDVRYLYIPSYTPPGDYRFNQITLQVNLAEQAVCDPCLLGSWQVDNASFSDFMNTIFDEYVPQVGNFQTVIQGNYYLQFDSEGKIQTQREGLTAYIYLESQFSVAPTLDPYNPGPQITNTPSSIPVYTGVEINSSGIGNYSADGDYMRVTQFVDVVGGVNTTPLIVESSPGGFLWIPVGSEFEFGPAFNANQEPGSTEDVVYNCEGDLLDITMNETGTDLLLTRVEKILPTPVPTQYIPTAEPAE